MKKKLLAALLALVMIVSMLPLAVSAEEECIHGAYGQLGPYAADENQHYYICSNCGEISGYMEHYDGQTNTYAATDDGVIAWTGSTEGSDGVCDECGYGCQHTNTAVANYDTYCMEYCVSCGTILSTTSTDPEPTTEIVASGTCGDNLTWVLDDSGTLTISGTGAMDSSPWYDYGDQIKTVVIEDGVTSISLYAFMGCISLTNVTIPNSVTSIGEGAFHDCISLTSVTIPDSVTYIGAYAFEFCASLTAIEVDPDNANYCSQDGVLFSKDMTTLIACPARKTGAYVIPAGVTRIEDRAFYVCDRLTSVTIPDSVTYIGWGAFQYCSALTSVTIPDSVTYIGADAFVFCASLTAIEVDPDNANYCSQDGVLFSKDMTTLIACPVGKTGAYVIPAGVTSIGSGAFALCFSLTSVTIPDSVTDIGWEVFAHCTSLTAIEVDPDNANYCSQDGVLFSKDMTTLIACPAGKTGAYVIPAGVTRIEDRAFYVCDRLTSVTIPNSVTSIGEGAFAGCTSLNTVIFEGNAPAIGSQAFCYVTATAYYPAENETWTEDVMQNYGGTITWVAYSETEPTEPEPTDPEVTEPEVTEPEVTDPEVTEPETTEPETTDPDTGDTGDTGADDEAKTGDNALVFLALALLCIALPVVKKFVF